VDIATAQEVLGMEGRLSRIDLIAPGGGGGRGHAGAHPAILPPGARIDATAARAGTVNEMTAAFSLNLTALSLLALVVGMFLIYNTVTFSVIQRRPVLGTLRALGMTRPEIFLLIVGEAGLLGFLGSVLGLGLGVVLGRGAVEMVTQTVNDLFFVVAVRDVEIPLWTLVKGGVIGMAAALVGAAIPAWEATSVPPAGALKRSNVEESALRLLPWLSLAALAIIGVGAALLIPNGNLVVTFGGLFLIVIGAALLTPICTLWLMRGAQRLLARGGVVERMAPRTVVRSLSRMAVAVAALMVAVSVIIGVGVMIGSFRQTVVLWLDDVLQADIFISAPIVGAGADDAGLSPALAEELRTFPGIVDAASTREVGVTGQLAPDGAALGLQLVALSDDLAGPDRRYRSAVGDWQADLAGHRRRRTADQRADGHPLQAGRGRPGLFADGRGAASLPHRRRDGGFRRAFQRAAGRCGLSAILGRRPAIGIALFVAEGVDVDATVNEIRSSLAGRAELLVQFQPRAARECAGRLRPHLCHHRGAATAGDRGGLHRHLQHADEPATGAHPRDRRAAFHRHDAAAVVAALALGNGAGGRHRGAVGDADGLRAGADPDLHHQPPLLWLDAGDAPAAGGVHPGVSGGTGGGAARGHLPGVAHRADTAGGSAAVGVNSPAQNHRRKLQVALLSCTISHKSPGLLERR
jgi:putative ABC transport system permease protein